jgi:hypothetical protein
VPATFRITHPFHPLTGQDLELITRRSIFGRDRIYYYDAERRLRCVPIAWTSLAPPDSFVEASAGRALFRPADLLGLVQEIEGLTGHGARQREGRSHV